MSATLLLLPSTDVSAPAVPSPVPPRRRRAAIALVLLVLGVLAVPLRATSQQGASNIDIGSVPDNPDPARRLFSLINAERAAEGLGQLRWNSTLEVVALDWSATMADEERLYHRPDLADVITSAWRRMGENVGVGPEIDRLHQAFMDSPGHRRNVAGDYDQVGIAVVDAGPRIWVAVNFGKGTITSTYVQRPATTVTSTATGTFSDVPRAAVHFAGIEALSSAGITGGCDADRYCPGRHVTRGQMATFVANAMDLRMRSSSSFSDVRTGSVFDAAIAAVSGAGVMEQCTSGRFCPTTAVTRAEMAGILSRMLDLPATRTTTRFSDVAGAQLIGQVEAIAAAGVTEGCGDGRFCPTGLVTRAEMATFLSNALALD